MRAATRHSFNTVSIQLKRSFESIWAHASKKRMWRTSL